MTAAVTVPASTQPGSYAVTIQATTPGAPAPLTTSFTLNVTSNPDFIMSETSPLPGMNVGGAAATGAISLASQDGFAGTVNLSCPATYGAGVCSISPSSVSSFPATATLIINGTGLAAGAYTLAITGSSGAVVHTLEVPFSIGDYSLSRTQSLSGIAGSQVTAALEASSHYAYNGEINVTCDATAIPAAVCSVTPANPVTLYQRRHEQFDRDDRRSE